MSKKLIMITNIKIKEVPRCAKCSTIKSSFDKITDKDELETIATHFFLD